MDESIAARMGRVEALLAGHRAPSSPATGPTDALRATLVDPSASVPDRRAALAALAERLRGEPDLSEILLACLDDPDSELVRDAIAAAPPFDGRVLGRVRALLDDPRDEVWAAAASALARKKVHAILPLMMAWAREGDAAHRVAGLGAVAFLLRPEEHLAAVEAICEAGPRDDEDEAVLVEALRVAEARVAFWRKALDREGDP